MKAETAVRRTTADTIVYNQVVDDMNFTNNAGQQRGNNAHAILLVPIDRVVDDIDRSAAVPEQHAGGHVPDQVVHDPYSHVVSADFDADASIAIGVHERYVVDDVAVDRDVVVRAGVSA